MLCSSKLMKCSLSAHVSSPERFRLAARDPPCRRPAFGTLMVAAMLLTAGPFAATAYTQLWLQSVLVLSPIDAGLVLAPMAIVSFAVSLSVDLETARRALDTLDDQALATVGLGPEVSVPPIPSRAGGRPPKPTLRAVLHDRLPLTPAAKTALRTTEKDMRRRRPVDPRQVLVALLDLEPPDPAAQLLTALGVDREAVRAQLAG